MTDELNSPPFDPTPVEVAEFTENSPFMPNPGYFIVVRSPKSRQTGDESALVQDSMCAPSLKGWWREVFGPSKSDLRVKIDQLDSSLLVALKGQGIRDRRIEILEKQVSIWEKTYTTVSELAQQRIQDIATLRHSLNAANEEIERLAMAPQLIASRKAPRKKKVAK